MPESGEWERLIEAAAGARAAPIRAETYLKKWGTASAPVLVRAGGSDYVVKGAQVARQAVNDQVVGRLGMALKAPVGEVCLIDVPAELIAAEPEMQHLPAGVAHGSRFVEGCSERASFEHASLADNRERFAALAVLHGWTFAHNDQQFIYRNAPPHLVYSVDHGHFFPNGPDWTFQTLAAASAAQPDPAILRACTLATTDLQEPGERLRQVPDSVIASAVAAPPDTWRISVADRVSLAQYLARRRDELVACLFPMSG